MQINVNLKANELEWHPMDDLPKKDGDYWILFDMEKITGDGFDPLETFAYTVEGGWNTRYTDEGLRTKYAIKEPYGAVAWAKGDLITATWEVKE